MYGPQFRDLHLLFDEFAAEMLESFDEFAERLRMIGQDPVFSLDQVRETATMEVAKGGHENLRKMIEEADRNLIRMIKEMRDANEAAEDANDPGTIDLIGKSVRVAEKQEWYFREMLKSGDTRLSPKSR